MDEQLAHIYKPIVANAWRMLVEQQNGLFDCGLHLPSYHAAGGDSGKWLNFDQDQMHAGPSCELSLPSHSMEPQRNLDTVSIGSHAMNLGGGPVSIFTWGSQCRL